MVDNDYNGMVDNDYNGTFILLACRLALLTAGQCIPAMKQSYCDQVACRRGTPSHSEGLNERSETPHPASRPQSFELGASVDQQMHAQLKRDTKASCDLDKPTVL